jgi:pimeloyl-ACP methyl ester carboxylesterase
MKAVLIILLALMTLSRENPKNTIMNNSEKNLSGKDSVSGYADINGLKMYYEIHGKGSPLVLIHGGGSTIKTSFGRVLHLFAKNRQVIAVELQGHGHTPDLDRPESFKQDADDVAALLKYLKIEKADFFGFSNGGQTTLQIAISYPRLVRKIIVGSAPYKRDGMYPWFWDSMDKATLDNMPQQLKDEYLKVAPNPNDLIKMFEKDKNRMIGFKSWSDEEVRSVTAPALIISADADVVKPEHAVEMYRLLTNARLSILPGEHGAYIGEITTNTISSKLPELTVQMIEEFLNEPMPDKK